ncbi:zinc finger protein 615-like [Condylostylus longicornis]|uniref:zinc finger protein 615-like n=1 Tax=Condylostylus longicornis TaxID=2530218 RepID=UPI00244DD1D2|nr:zinc finger protein 615-like [Condylostylus longicornis]
MTSKAKSRLECFIPGCKTRFGKDKNIKFHKIRKSVIESKDEKQRWLDALPFLKEEDFLKSNYRMCSRHFREEDYIHRSLRHFKREKDLKPFAMPTLNLPRMPNQEEIEIETSDTGNFCINSEGDIFRNSPKLSKRCVKQTKHVGIQCNISGPFANDSLNNFFYDNFSMIEKYIFNQMNLDKINFKSEDEILAEINDEGSFTTDYQKEPTCDIPDDDIFFNEILLKKNNNLLTLGFHCCEHCGLTFTDIRSYRDHEGVHAEISLLCCYCGEVSADYLKNIEHEYRCRKTKQIENGETTLTKRKKRSRKILNDYSISEESFCPISKDNKKDQDSHLEYLNVLKMKEKDLVGYFCSICQQCFSSEELCQKHLEQHTFKDQTTHNFNDVYDTPTSNREYKISGDTTIEFLKNPTEEFSCQICGRAYATEYLLERHVDVKHLNPIQKSPIFRCTECEMTFRNFVKLQSHVKEHVISLKHCKICNVAHDDNEKYLNHLRNPQHLLLEEKWKNRYKVNSFSCYLCKTTQAEYNELANLAEHSDYHRISKTRTFINGLLAEYEIKHFKP